ncbi:MAG: SIS domain-containing protein [Pirellulales bacterium]|jgi:D-sedoheptulose 7-phosphate isomerase|nr:SIS domain-containing protein [Thermoguttaceae bacterium]MDD4788272.1 SIS domain-containing protein [Pirellulales bacterium]MDI9446538.1 SIS domain-containing protein [Planctomycetota bacterium]NLZ03024.1 SIS domain-containing protein [Pirellulaceae bacterium]
MLGLTHGIGEYLARLCEELGRLDRAPIVRLAEAIYAAWQADRFIFVFGNGGSAATASHVCEDLGKNALRPGDLHDDKRRRVRVLSLTDNVSWITALGNDLAYEEVFSQQLRQYASPGDLAIAISGSGNSPNIIAAVDWANQRGLKTFGMTGYNGGRLKQIQHDGIHVDLADMGMVESIHASILHWVVEDIHARINHTGRFA